VAKSSSRKKQDRAKAESKRAGQLSHPATSQDRAVPEPSIGLAR
jgi:hypothetical protein